jgi:hypothetical protein
MTFPCRARDEEWLCQARTKKKALWSGPSFPRIMGLTAFLNAVRSISQEIEKRYLPTFVISRERFASQLGGWKVQKCRGSGAVGEGSAVPSLHRRSIGTHRPCCLRLLQLFCFDWCVMELS